MTILDAAFWAVSLVVVASGATKLAEPQPFAEALRSLSSRAHHGPAAADDADGPGRSLAIGVGLVEIALGLNALVLGGAVVAWLIAFAYAGFAVVVIVARRRGLASCGCFGARSGPPSATHAALNAASAIVAAAAALAGPVALADGLGGLRTGVAAVVVAAVLAVAATIVVVDTR